MVMNDLPRQTLCQLIRQYGHDVIDEPRRVRAMLRDLCPDSRREINVLGYAMDELIPKSLLNASIALSPAILHANLSNRLCQELALSEEAAVWAVETWAFALSLDGVKEKAAPISKARQEAPLRRSANLLAHIKKTHHLSTAPAKPALTAPLPAWAKLSGTFRLPSLRQSGMMQRLGRGKIVEVMVLDDQGRGKEPTLLVIAGGGAALFDGSDQPLWEIDCPASCAALSHDKQLLALGCKNTIYLWSMQSGQFLQSLKAHDLWINSLIFSPNGQSLASAGRDIKIWVWDVATGQALYYLSGHTKAINSLAFSPDSQILVSASDDQTIRLWSHQEELHTLRGQSKEINHVAFSPDGKSIASASNDGTIRLWDLNPRPLHNLSLKKQLKSVRHLSFSPNGYLLASVDNASYQIELWDVANARHLRSLAGHNLLLESITFTSDSRKLISGSLDKTVRLWDISHGHEERRIEVHSQSVQTIALSKDGRLLAALYHASKSIHLWDIRQARELPALKGHRGFVRSIAFDPHQPRLASASSDETLRLWDISRQIEVARLNKTGEIRQISFNPAGNILAFINQETTLYLWDISSLSHLRANFVDATSSPKSDLKALKGHHKALTSLAFSPDGKLLASASRDGTICLWGIPSGHEAFRLSPKHTSYAAQIAFSPDSRLLAAIESGTSMIRLWDLTTQEELSPLIGHSAQITSIAFSPNRPLIASASVDGTIRLWHPHSARQERCLEGHADYVTSVAFNPNDGNLASASRDGTIRLWKVG